ncbi:unnamed protein product, partial [Rotaria sp. Silwood1]
ASADTVGGGTPNGGR